MAESEFDPYAASKQVENKPQQATVPDFVTKTKEYIRQHPEVIREVAGDEIQKLEAYLDTLPLGLGAIGKAKLNEFLGGAGNGSGVQEGVRNTPGQEFMLSDGQGQGEEPKITAEEDLTISEQKEVIEFMADLSEQGFDLARIQMAIRREWGLEYHPLTIKRMLAAYYNRPEPEPEPENGKRGSIQILEIYKHLLEKNAELQKKIAELTPKPTPEVVESERKGVIRRFLSWLW